MELNVHIDLCEALLEDFLIQFQNPLLLQDAVALEGLFKVDGRNSGRGVTPDAQL